MVFAKEDVHTWCIVNVGVSNVYGIIVKVYNIYMQVMQEPDFVSQSVR